MGNINVLGIVSEVDLEGLFREVRGKLRENSVIEVKREEIFLEVGSIYYC